VFDWVSKCRKSLYAQGIIAPRRPASGTEEKASPYCFESVDIDIVPQSGGKLVFAVGFALGTIGKHLFTRLGTGLPRC
jgi:hypothetical protein